MGTFDYRQKWKTKYPFIFDIYNLIDLNKIGGILNIYNRFEKDNKSLNTLGLIDFKKDLPYILDKNYLKKQRKEKLLNIQKK